MSDYVFGKKRSKLAFFFYIYSETLTWIVRLYNLKNSNCALTPESPHFDLIFTEWKVSKCKVFSCPYFLAFGLNAERYYYVSLSIQFECQKILCIQMRSFFWSVFSRIQTEYGEILLLISPYSPQSTHLLQISTVWREKYSLFSKYRVELNELSPGF